MNLSVAHGTIQNSKTDTIIVDLFEGVLVPGGATGAVDQALGGAIRELIESGDLTGKLGEVGVLYPRGAIAARRVLVVGLGSRAEMTLETVRKASAAALKKARDLNAKEVATIVHGAGVGGLAPEEAAQATIEGAMLALYQYPAPRKKAEPKGEIQSLVVLENDAAKLPAIQNGVRIADVVVQGATLARNLVNMPANVATPTRLAEAALELAGSYPLDVFIGDRSWAEEQGMGAFLAVAKGAGEPPKFIVMEHNPGRADLGTIVLVGKGITFDTGGISLKPHEGMGDMKSDMAGAAAVIGTMMAAAMLELPLHLVGITPCTENMPDANAYRPADVVTASNGKTIEIISTDAEGRLILADALVYAQRYQPQAVVDLATLTGACVIALGDGTAAGIFCNDESLQDKLVASGKKTHERLWPLPLWDDYRQKIKSEVADMKNSGGRYGGVGTSAIFLKEFTDYPWAHLDIAGVAMPDKPGEYAPPGATGFGVRLLVEFLRSWN
jgi:leucyl aminopeptidase